MSKVAKFKLVFLAFAMQFSAIALQSPLVSSTYANAAKKSLGSGDILNARRFAKQAVALAVYNENNLPKCGEGYGNNNITYTAFPVNDALHIYVVDAGRISYYDLTQGVVKRLWQVGILNKFGSIYVKSKNPVTAEFSDKTSGFLSVSFQCGVQPESSKTLIQYIVYTPPGYVDGGLLDPNGKFTLIKTREFSENNQEPFVNGLSQRYAQWIIDMP